jgi:hypothetical protein
MAGTKVHTSADWWVTAGQSCDAARAGLDCSRTAPDLLHTLTELEGARRASTVAVGAAVEALLASGTSWDRIAAALGLPGAEAAPGATAESVAAADEAMRRRLG